MPASVRPKPASDYILVGGRWLRVEIRVYLRAFVVKILCAVVSTPFLASLVSFTVNQAQDNFGSPDPRARKRRLMEADYNFGSIL
jgi:hypothetical protein